MKNKTITTVLLFTAMFLFTSCEVIKGIFNAGVGFGIFIVIAVFAIIIFIITRFTKKD